MAWNCWSKSPHAPQQVAVILLTAMGSVDAAVTAMKRGAFDFIEKPVNPTRLRNILQNATRIRGTERELEASRRKLRDVGVLGSLVGPSKKMQEIFRLIEMVAPSTASVLITGESGTGKELVARTIHSLSNRKARPFVAINCAAIPETLDRKRNLRSRKGRIHRCGRAPHRMFRTGRGRDAAARRNWRNADRHPGQAACASWKTASSAAWAAKAKPSVDVRVLAATNKPPEEAVARGQLRNDLYYRLNVFNIHMPPLREHMDDLSDLVQALLADMNEKHNRTVVGVQRSGDERLPSSCLAGQCARIAQYPGARRHRVRRPDD